MRRAHAIGTVLVGLVVGLGLALGLSGRAPVAKTHVTIYLGLPLLEEGGAVVVAGRKVPEAQWRAVQGGPNPAAGDMANPKRAHVRPGDRHFGAVANSPVTVVEFIYPEGGSYTFNLLPLPEHQARYGTSLRTTRVSVGSGGIQDPETRELIDWPSLSDIAVLGPDRDESWARLAGATYFNAIDQPGAKISRFEGVRTIELSRELIVKYVVNPKG
jgi:hypothetical protein